MTPSESLINDLNTLQDKFKTAIAQIIEKGAGASNMELAQAIAELDFFQELKVLGLTENLTSFFNSYNTQIQSLLDLAGSRGVRNTLSVNSNTLDIRSEERRVGKEC